ncbi:MAG: cardiolipin synthase [Gammaproteobacteria bacterium]|jgi:cardiolipin synthase|nr:cardiolipin synthase [Gammaproteobacteria bacterium]
MSATDITMYGRSDIVVPLIHLVLAAGVTVHVLLTKREAGSSVAWIGLSWLAPILGSVLYLLLGINRVKRRAQSLRRPRPAPRARRTAKSRSDHFAALELAGERITGRPTEDGNSIDVLRNGDNAYPQMLAAIDAATQSIALSSYIFRADAAGIPFIDALLRAKQRGVEVRVLIDGYGGGYFTSSTYHRLHRADVPAARFLHSTLPWRMPFLNLRSHKKILGIDGRSVFTGGLNIGAENLTQTHPKHPVFDTHFKFEGPVVAQLIDVFAADWLFATQERLSGDAWFPALAPTGDSTARVVTSGPDNDLEKIEFVILQALSCARTSIRIMTPYFLPDERIITALSLAAYRGVEVDLVLPEHSNHPTVDWGSRVQMGPLLKAGGRVWTYPAPFNHSKLMTIDDLWAMVGSANWDVRSFRLNFELDLEVYHSGVVREINSLITAHQGARLNPSTLEGRSFPLRLRDGAARLLVPYL